MRNVTARVALKGDLQTAAELSDLVGGPEYTLKDL